MILLGIPTVWPSTWVPLHASWVTCINSYNAELEKQKKEFSVQFLNVSLLCFIKRKKHELITP
jgi:hypothetical protein